MKISFWAAYTLKKSGLFEGVAHVEAASAGGAVYQVFGMGGMVEDLGKVEFQEVEVAGPVGRGIEDISAGDNVKLVMWCLRRHRRSTVLG